MEDKIITGWTINSGNQKLGRCVYNCGAILDFPDSDFSSGIPLNVASELLIHQEYCILRGTHIPKIIMPIEDNQMSEQKINKKRDDIFKQIFN